MYRFKTTVTKPFLDFGEQEKSCGSPTLFKRLIDRKEGEDSRL